MRIEIMRPHIHNVILMLYACVNFWIKLQIRLVAANSHKPNSRMQTSPTLLAKSMFECLQHASQACTKTCVILRAK